MDVGIRQLIWARLIHQEFKSKIAKLYYNKRNTKWLRLVENNEIGEE